MSNMLSEFPPVRDGEDSIITEHRDAHLAHVELYRGVVAHLPGWKFEQTISDRCWYGPSYRYKLVDGQGHAIDLQFGRYQVQKGKVNVSGYWPKRDENSPCSASPSDVREDSPSINVSLERGHAVIAKQIQTRFLPEYLRIFAMLVDKIGSDQAYQDRQADNWKRLMETDAIDWVRYNDREQKGRLYFDGEQGYGDVRMSSADTVQMDLRSLSVETAIRVLEALKGGK